MPRFYLILVTLLLFSLQILVNQFAENYVFQNVVSITSILIVFYYCNILYKIDSKFFLSSMPIIFYYIGLMVSLTAYLIPIYLVELGVVARGTFEITFIAIFFMASMEITKIGYGFKINIFFKQRKIEYIATLFWKFIILITIVISFYIYSLYGSPYDLLISRSAFWQDVVPYHLKFARSLIVYSFFFVSLYYFSHQKNEWFIFSIKKLTLSATYLFSILFVLGDKFSAFILFFSAFSVVIASRDDCRPSFRRILLFGLMAVLALILLVAYIYSFSNLVSNDPVFEIILSRIGSQAQLLWAVFRESVNTFAFGDSKFKLERFSEIDDYLSYKYQPYSLYVAKVNGPGTLSGYFPTSGIIAFGIINLLFFHAIISIIYGVLQRGAVECLRRNMVLTSFLFYTSMLTINQIWLSSKFEQIYRFGLLLLILLISFIIANSFRKR